MAVAVVKKVQDRIRPVILLIITFEVRQRPQDFVFVVKSDTFLKIGSAGEKGSTAGKHEY